MMDKGRLDRLLALRQALAYSAQAVRIEANRRQKLGAKGAIDHMWDIAQELSGREYQIAAQILEETARGKEAQEA